MLVIGIMSGSSLDGLDIAACRFTLKQRSPFNCSWSILAGQTYPFPGSIKSGLESAHQMDALSFTQLDVDLGIWVGETTKAFLNEIKEEPELIAWHGHTVFHYPEKKLSVQIGSGTAIAVTSGIDVLSQFRQADVISGGEGAPLAALVDKYLFPGYDFYLNLGGIGNMSFYDNIGIIRSFDICPVNQILNRLSRLAGLDFDENGILASKGNKQNLLLQQLNSWNYYKKKYPKSLDNQQIATHFWPIIDRFPGSVSDKLNTYCHHITEKILMSALQVSSSKQGKILVTGGGAYNTFLIECLKFKLQSIGIEAILPAPAIIDFKETLIMALMGFMWKNGIPNILHEVTGAPFPCQAGTYHKGHSEKNIKHFK